MPATSNHKIREDHRELMIDNRTFLSVGIDVGSSTCHLTLSALEVGRPESAIYDKPRVLKRQVLYRSPVRFTPFLADGGIDGAELRNFVEENYESAGIRKEDIGAGAVICTGEAALRHNAEQVTHALAGVSGSFVCATAGHHYEAVLAAHGSGAVEASRHLDLPVISLDIGGGTTKRSFIRNGTIEETTAINVGCRLIAYDEENRVRRLESAGLAIARSIGLDLHIGDELSPIARRDLSRAAARIIHAFLGLSPMKDLETSLLLTPQPAPLPNDIVLTQPPRVRARPFALVISGGVSEFIFHNSDYEPRDLGPNLGRELRHVILSEIPQDKILAPAEGIRATVIGAGHQTLDVSGDTVFESSDGILPLRDVSVREVRIVWEQISASHVSEGVRSALERCDTLGRVAIFIDGPPKFGYSKVADLAAGINAAWSQFNSIEILVVICAKNIANILGDELRRVAPQKHFVCLDEIRVSELDFIDIDRPPAGDGYLPVAIKTLVFSRKQN